MYGDLKRCTQGASAAKNKISFGCARASGKILILFEEKWAVKEKKKINSPFLPSKIFFHVNAQSSYKF
jgi:hypothetical protein